LNKYSIITGAAIAVIVIPFLFSALNIVAVDSLNYRWAGDEEFRYFELLDVNNKVEICNASPFWVSFNKFAITAFYEETNLGTFMIDQTSLEPGSSEIKNGDFSSPEFVVAQHMFLTFDAEFDGDQIRLDPNLFNVIVEVDTPILGFIPYSVSKQMNAFFLDEIMRQESCF
jgi:hypothetical protein